MRVPPRGFGLTLRTAALVTLAAALGCTSPICAGVATCYAPPAQGCGRDAPGCAPTAGCLLYPSYGKDCTVETTASDCLGNVADGDYRCSWSNGVCTGACNAVTDSATCQSTPYCSWSSCTGTPKSCDTYSAESCPASLGCYVMTPPANGII